MEVLRNICLVIMEMLGTLGDKILQLGDMLGVPRNMRVNYFVMILLGCYILSTISILVKSKIRKKRHILRVIILSLTFVYVLNITLRGIVFLG